MGWQNCTYVSGSWTYAKEDLEIQTYLGATPGEARLSPLEFEKLDKEKLSPTLVGKISLKLKVLFFLQGSFRNN